MGVMKFLVHPESLMSEWPEVQNAYITAPVWRTTENEKEYAIRLRNFTRQQKSKTAPPSLPSFASVQKNPSASPSSHSCESASIRGSEETPPAASARDSPTENANKMAQPPP